MHKLMMGGYGSYVWSAYLLVSVILIANVVLIKQQKVKSKKQLKQWLKSNP